MSILERLKEKEVILTPQRLAVAEFMDKNHRHPTAEDVYARLKKKYPTMSFATVYSTLELLESLGEVQRLTIRKEKACWDYDAEPHHHFLCEKCDKIIDLKVDCPVLKRKSFKGHKVKKSRGYFYGICSDCLKGG